MEFSSFHPAHGDAVRLLQVAGVEDVVASGEALLAPPVTRRLIEEFAQRPKRSRGRPRKLDSLTERKLEVLLEVARGFANAEP